MCGRFTRRTPTETVAELFAWLPPADYEYSYNVTPTQDVAAVRFADSKSEKSGEPMWSSLRWGLIPSWSDDPNKKPLINARSESIATLPSFRAAFKRRRCLIAADGFYEWRATGKEKQPVYVHLKDHRPFFFAGLWERYSEADKTIESCTIITTDANDYLSPIHHRMPVIMDEENLETWLDPEFKDQKFLESMLRPYPPELMNFYTVSVKVNKATFDEPSCIERAKEQRELF